MSEGVKVQHATLRSCVATVPLPHRPMQGLSIDRCPTCNTVHMLKTVHLWLDDLGRCVVSHGVLNDLQRAGMPELTVIETVKNPPMLVVGEQREATDYRNRRIVTVGNGGTLK